MTARSAPSVALRVRLPCADEQELVSRMARAFSPSGMFLSTRAPKEPGTRLLFEVLYANGTTALRGEGTVVRAVADPPRPGMTIAFTRLDAASRELLERIATVRRNTPPAGIPLAEPEGPPPPARAAHATAVLPEPGPRVELPASAPEIALGLDWGGSFFRAAVVRGDSSRPVAFDGAPALALPPELDDDLLITLLQLALNAAERQEEARVSRVVIAVPSSMGPGRRAAIRDAALQAGIGVVRILSATAARAVACGAGRGLARKRLLILDAGSRFSAGLVEITGDEIEVVATRTMGNLAGAIDEALAALALRDVELTHGPVQGEARARAVLSARIAKEILCSEERARIRAAAVASGPDGPVDLDVELDRAALAQAAGPLLDAALFEAHELLRSRNLTPSQVDEVVLAGGQASLPPLLDRVAEAFGSRLRATIDPEGSAALGAALAGAAILADQRDLPIHEVLAWPVGLLGQGGTVRVLERNARLPAERVVRVEGPAQLSVVAVEADSDEPVAGLVLPGPRASVLVRVDRDGTVALSPVGTGTGRREDPALLLEAARHLSIEPGSRVTPPPQNAESGGLLGNIRRFFGRGR